MTAIADRLQRRVMPRLVVRLSTVDRHHRWAAAIRRRLGGSATVRLFIAFDDPASAVALVGLAGRLRGRRVRLIVEPVVERGIPGDPAVEDKRRYAVIDAARLARRQDRTLARTEPVAAHAVADLAAAAAGIADQRKRTAFCVAAMEHLWFGAADAPAHEPADPAALRRSERSFGRRRLYDTPVAVVHGRWFFAHERLAQIEERLDDLGWAVAL